jgi:hypothetical protein
MMSIFRPKLDLLFSGLGNSFLFHFFSPLIDGSFMCKYMGAFKLVGLWGVYDGTMAFVYLHQRAGWLHDWMGMGGVDGIMKSPFRAAGNRSPMSLMLWWFDVVCIAERAPELSLDTNPPRDIIGTISMHQNPWNMEAMCNQELALAIFTLSHMFSPRTLQAIFLLPLELTASPPNKTI